jgi:hypothetical protein
VERGGEEARASRWAAGTPAAAIKAGGLGAKPFQGEEGAGRLEAVTIGCSAHWREEEAAWGGEGARGNGRPARPGRWSGRLRVEDGPDRWAPPVSGV